ncbi:hypothetical protein CVT26_011636 [Gymnopilus dilepis]|uniref:Uncharacterized protein n=1 Tax=Gymnopilus dilepis TaxID=231916 RepID=A0A409YQM4_9AGAR|nr:hypothetical protein CVT26_011636 [Gymnopilus dilepis]
MSIHWQCEGPNGEGRYTSPVDEDGGLFYIVWNGSRALKPGEVLKLELLARKGRHWRERLPNRIWNKGRTLNGGRTEPTRRFSISQSERSIPESLFAVNFRAAPCALGSLEMRFIIPLQGLSEVHGRTLGIDLARIRNWSRG